MVPYCETRLTVKAWAWSETISPRMHFTEIYELINKILRQCFLLCSLSLWCNQVTILHMSRQLSCRDMCKIVNRSDHYFPCHSKIFFTRFGLQALTPFVKWVPEILRYTSFALSPHDAVSINSLKPSNADTCMYRRAGSSLVQVMACCLMSTKTLHLTKQAEPIIIQFTDIYATPVVNELIRHQSHTNNSTENRSKGLFIKHVHSIFIS